jgi:uncharacterized membrane protein
MRIIKGAKRPSSPRTARLIRVVVPLVALVVHFVVFIATKSHMVTFFVDLVLIAIIVPITVSHFRALSRASAEEVKRNPRPW